MAKRDYLLGWMLTLATILLLVWLSLAVGINGPDGEPFDRIYLAVFAVGFIMSAIGRFKPLGMARALLGMSFSQTLVIVVALVEGKHLSGVSPVLEIVALNGFFAALFAAAAWLFRRACRTSVQITAQRSTEAG